MTEEEFWGKDVLLSFTVGGLTSGLLHLGLKLGPASGSVSHRNKYVVAIFDGPHRVDYFDSELSGGAVQSPDAKLLDSSLPGFVVSEDSDYLMRYKEIAENNGDYAGDDIRHYSLFSAFTETMHIISSAPPTLVELDAH